jgi:hypothetical protein
MPLKGASSNRWTRLRKRIAHDVFHCLYHREMSADLSTAAALQPEAAALVGSTAVRANVSVSECLSPTFENCSDSQKDHPEQPWRAQYKSHPG